MKPRAFSILAAWVSLALGASVSMAEAPQAEPQKPGQEFLRLRRAEDQQPLALETAIVSFSPRDGSRKLAVDLVGAVHVADEAYYDKLNEVFESYDAVLYELVAPQDTRPQPGQRSANAVSFLQVTMKNVLDLQFQLDCIDYTCSNMVHADMTPEEFARTMDERGESFMQMFLRMLGQSIAMQSKDPTRSGDAQLFAALFADPKERSRRLKTVMAEQFEDMEAATSVLDGPDGSTILTERNKAALKVLASEIAKGKKRIAIFYGAAHLPDMAERLEDEFQLQRTETRWLTAWGIAEPRPSDSD